LLALLLAGCGSPNHANMQPSANVYRGDDVVRFLNSTSPPAVEREYLIGVGDRLDIKFFVHKELSAERILVRSDGRITLQYVGDVPAAGLTPMQLDSALTTRFAEVLRDPNLSVIVAEPAEKLVYVLGEVKAPGGFDFDTRVSLLGAVAMAGGLLNGAKSNHVLVIRRDGPDKVVGAEIDLASAAKGERIGNDIWLRNYDIVFVPKTRLKSTADFVSILYDVVYKPLDIGVRGWQIDLWRKELEFRRED